MSLAHEEIRDIAEAAADKAVQKTLLAIGVNASDPEQILEMQADFLHLRRWRQSTETVKKRALLTAISVIVTGTLGYLWLLFGPHR